MTQATRKEEPVETDLPEDNGAARAPDDDLPEISLEDKDTSAAIAALEVKLAETNDKMLRAMAETENLRRRSERERQDTAKFSVATFARDLLTVADNLRRALDAITPEQRTASPALANIYTGVEATERELQRVFEGNGIKKIIPLDQPFDANLHEVMFEADAPGKPPGSIVQVIAPGYTIHERLLRPARVGVAKGGGDAGGMVDKEI